MKLKDFVKAIEVEAEIIDVVAYDYETETFINIAGFCDCINFAEELENRIEEENRKYLDYAVANIRCSIMNRQSYMVIELEGENYES